MITLSNPIAGYIDHSSLGTYASNTIRMTEYVDPMQVNMLFSIFTKETSPVVSETELPTILSLITSDEADNIKLGFSLLTEKRIPFEADTAAKLMSACRKYLSISENK